MARDIERHIRIQNPEGARRGSSAPPRAWKTIPNCDKVRVWEYLTLESPNEETGVSERRFIFHIGFVDGVHKGSRVTYLGNQFSVLNVSDSKRLVGLELSCAATAS